MQLTLRSAPRSAATPSSGSTWSPTRLLRTRSAWGCPSAWSLESSSRPDAFGVHDDARKRADVSLLRITKSRLSQACHFARTCILRHGRKVIARAATEAHTASSYPGLAEKMGALKETDTCASTNCPAARTWKTGVAPAVPAYREVAVVSGSSWSSCLGCWAGGSASIRAC